MYPKKIEIENDKLKEMLDKKGVLITQGRAISTEIEEIEAQMKEIDDKLVEAEKEIDISDIDANAEDITRRFNELRAEMDEVNRLVRERLSEKVPAELKNRYDELKKKKDKLEEDRNKVAIKAQKYNDKLIPLSRELMKDHIVDTFDDFGSIKVEDGKVIGEIINHLEEYKINFLKKKLS